MYKPIVLFVALSFSSICLAKECPPEPELDADITRADEDGETQMRALLDQLVASRGMSKEQTADYLKALLLRDGPRTAQGLRMYMASSLAGAVKTGRCSDITKAKKNARGVIIAQWQTVNEEIQKDVTAAASTP